MPKFKLEVEIDMGNEAFDDGQNGALELARILKDATGASFVMAHNSSDSFLGEETTAISSSIPLKDINGNRVGRAFIEMRK